MSDVLGGQDSGQLGLPNFVIIGAMRSGSTSLYRYLKDHPHVFMPRKEIQFFDRYWERGLDWYSDLFDAHQGQPAVGEASPNYLASPVALERMRSVIPEARLLAILRDPADRAYSHYWMEHSRGRDPRTFEEAIAEELEHGAPDTQPPRDYLRRSRYLPQLEQVCEHFDRSALQVVLLDDLQDDPTTTYVEVCRFLGIDGDVRPALLGEPVNQFVTFRSERLRRISKRLAKTSSVGRVVNRLNTVTAGEYPAMRDDTRIELVAHFADDNRRLADWLDRDLSAWL